MGAQFTFSSFIDVNAGDFYPRLGEFIIDGKRIRGVWGLKRILIG
ncbi:MAG: hypothetical protein Ct9H90mP20_6400 [Candidatus Neomarinimicrobiota bacterium]|nr:MAG: hypothetical protein Ct9H90mP20_6400 [Candidatus Neomarinimicrobiota bacterium]